MKYVLCIVTAALVGPMMAVPAFSGEPAATPEKTAAELVRQLGDPSYEVRQHAEEQLLKLGAAAEQAVLDGAHSTDLEVAERCRVLYAHFEPDVKRRAAEQREANVKQREADFTRRAEAFINDPEGKLQPHLPCWERYRKSIGEDKAARQVFIAMLKADDQLFAAAECDPDNLVGQLAKKMQSLSPAKLHRPATAQPKVMAKPEPQHTTGKGAVPGEIAGCLFLASDDKVVWALQNSRAPLLPILFVRHLEQEFTTDQDQVLVYRKIVVAWMDRQTEDLVVMALLAQTLNGKLPEGVEFAAHMVRDNKLSSLQIARALCCLGKYGTKEHIVAIEPLLETDRRVVVVSGAPEIEAELRDVALAALVHLTGQAHKDYHFKVNNNGTIDFSNLLPTQRLFVSKADRAAALKKWKEWKAAQKK